MENLNDKMPHETPEVLPVAAGFSPSMLVVGSLGVALLLFLGEHDTPLQRSWKDSTNFYTVLLITNRRKASSRGNALLLVGAPDAGKTALLSQVCQILPI